MTWTVAADRAREIDGIDVRAARPDHAADRAGRGDPADQARLAASRSSPAREAEISARLRRPPRGAVSQAAICRASGATDHRRHLHAGAVRGRRPVRGGRTQATGTWRATSSAAHTPMQPSRARPRGPRAVRRRAGHGRRAAAARAKATAIPGGALITATRTAARYRPAALRRPASARGARRSRSARVDPRRPARDRSLIVIETRRGAVGCAVRAGAASRRPGAVTRAGTKRPADRVLPRSGFVGAGDRRGGSRAPRRTSTALSGVGGYAEPRRGRTGRR